MGKKSQSTGTPNMGGMGQVAGRMMGNMTPSGGMGPGPRYQPQQQAPAPRQQEWADIYSGGRPGVQDYVNSPLPTAPDYMPTAAPQQQRQGMGNMLMNNPQLQQILQSLRNSQPAPAPVAAPAAPQQRRSFLGNAYKNQF